MGVQPAQIQDGATLACWVPCELGDCTGGQQLWLDWRQQLLKKFLHSCHLLGVRGDCEAPGWREEGEEREQEVSH